MESETHDAHRWEDDFSADRESAVPDTRTLVDEEPWAMYRGTGSGTIASTYVEAYLEQFNVDAGRLGAPETR